MLLRQWRLDELEPLFELYQQPEFLVHMSPLDLAGTRAQIERFTLRWTEDGFCVWAAIDLETGRCIGRIGLIRHHDWPLRASPVEVGWVLHRDYWGRGLATEGGQAAMNCWRDLLPDEQLISINGAGQRQVAGGDGAARLDLPWINDLERERGRLVRDRSLTRA